MNILDIIKNAVTLDSSKSYEIVEQTTPTVPPTIQTEIQPTIQTEIPPTTPTVPPTNTSIQIPTNTATPTTVTQNSEIDYKALYEQSQQKITTLEQANFKLLNSLPVQEQNKTTEQLIYDLCVNGGNKTYGNGNTGNGA